MYGLTGCVSAALNEYMDVKLWCVAEQGAAFIRPTPG